LDSGFASRLVYRDGTLAEYVAVEARNLTPWRRRRLHRGRALVMPGLTACRGCSTRPPSRGQRVLVHGAPGVVGSMASQLAREAGAVTSIGTGRAGGRQTALDFGATGFVDLEYDALEDVGEVDLVFDVICGDIGKRSAGLIRAENAVTVTGPTEARPLAA